MTTTKRKTKVGRVVSDKMDKTIVVSVERLARHRAEDPRAAGVALVVDEDGRVLVETDVAAVGTAELLGRAHDHGAHHIALLDGRVGNGLLDAGDDDVADPGRGLLRPTHDPDALDGPGAGIVGHLEAAVLLDHAGTSSAAS